MAGKGGYGIFRDGDGYLVCPVPTDDTEHFPATFDIGTAEKPDVRPVWKFTYNQGEGEKLIARLLEIKAQKRKPTLVGMRPLSAS